jgi:hypothetical protein
MGISLHPFELIRVVQVPVRRQFFGCTTVAWESCNNNARLVKPTRPVRGIRDDLLGRLLHRQFSPPIRQHQYIRLIVAFHLEIAFTTRLTEFPNEPYSASHAPNAIYARGKVRQIAGSAIGEMPIWDD